MPSFSTGSETPAEESSHWQHSSEGVQAGSQLSGRGSQPALASGPDQLPLLKGTSQVSGATPSSVVFVQRAQVLSGECRERRGKLEPGVFTCESWMLLLSSTGQQSNPVCSPAAPHRDRSVLMRADLSCRAGLLSASSLHWGCNKRGRGENSFSKWEPSSTLNNAHRC